MISHFSIISGTAPPYLLPDGLLSSFRAESVRKVYLAFDSSHRAHNAVNGKYEASP